MRRHDSNAGSMQIPFIRTNRAMRKKCIAQVILNAQKQNCVLLRGLARAKLQLAFYCSIEARMQSVPRGAF